MEFYYIIYFGLLPFIILDFKSNSFVTKRQVLLILSVFYSIIGGFGDWTGTDWTSYKYVFDHITWHEVVHPFKDSQEQGFLLLNWIFLHLTGGKFTIFMFCATLFYFVSFSRLFLKYTQYPIIIFAIFFFSGNQICIIRNRIAISILIWAIPCIFDRKFWKFIIICLLAISIHRSAAIFLLTYFFRYIPVNYILCNVLFLSTITLGYVFRDIFLSIGMSLGGTISDKISYYADEQSIEVSKSIISVFMNFIVLNCLILYKNKLSKGNKDQIFKNSYMNIFIYSYLLITSLDTIFLGIYADFARLGTILTPLFFLSWNYVICLFDKYYHHIFKVFCIVLIIYISQKFFMLDYFRPEYHNLYVPYSMIFV